MRKLLSNTGFGVLIKQELETVFGRSIVSYRDCVELSEDVFCKTGEQINPNTLRRLFGLVKSIYQPSLATFTILSKYCGYSSVDELYHSKQEKNAVPGQDQLLKYVVNMFMEIPGGDLRDNTFLTLVKNTIVFLNSNSVLADKFLIMVSKTNKGQHFYFEHFVNVDKLNAYYGNGIRYYLHQKADKNARIFAHSVFAFKYWLNGNKEKLLHQSEFLPVNLMEPLQTGSFIYSRWLAATIFCTMSTDIKTILYRAYQFHSTAALNEKNGQLINFMYVFSEALVLTGHYREAIHCMTNYRRLYAASDLNKYFTGIDNFYLLEAIAQYQLQNREEAENILNIIRPAEFHYLNRNLSGILYGKLMHKFGKTSELSQEETSRLIRETGFERLNNFLEE